MRLPVPLRKRKVDTHKGDYGHVFIVGGSEGMCGAVCLAAWASLRMGAGKVTIGCPRSLVPLVQVMVPEALALALPETAEKTISRKAYPVFREYVRKVDAVAIGMGASRNKETEYFLRECIVHSGVPLVVDADGLNACAGHARILKRKEQNIVVTPHLMEFSRISGYGLPEIKGARKKLAKEYALLYNLVLILKGPHSLITDGRQIFENITGNPGMATAGSGDVLSGMIVAFLGQQVRLPRGRLLAKVPAFEAAAAAVYLHGLAGDIAAREKTEISLVASDIIDKIPEAIKQLRSQVAKSQVTRHKRL